MKTFHLTKDFVAEQCNVKGRCPLGSAEDHFMTLDEANDYASKNSPEASKLTRRQRNKYAGDVTEGILTLPKDQL